MAVEQYLTDHNSAEQGLIYLRSAYRMMAVFSLALAFLLDIAAFVTGVIIEREESKLVEELGEPVQAAHLLTDEKSAAGRRGRRRRVQYRRRAADGLDAESIPVFDQRL